MLSLLLVSNPGPGAVSLGIKPPTVLLQDSQDLGLLLQCGLQAPVALQEVISVSQQGVPSQTLPPHRRTQLTEGLHSLTGSQRRQCITTTHYITPPHHCSKLTLKKVCNNSIHLFLWRSLRKLLTCSPSTDLCSQAWSQSWKRSCSCCRLKNTRKTPCWLKWRMRLIMTHCQMTDCLHPPFSIIVVPSSSNSAYSSV